jgi:hypothetical protein
VAQRNAFFEEGIRLDEEAKLRRQKLEEVKKRKLQELRYSAIRVILHRLDILIIFK